jgi:hypothetical protein
LSEVLSQPSRVLDGSGGFRLFALTFVGDEDFLLHQESFD